MGTPVQLEVSLVLLMPGGPELLPSWQGKVVECALAGHCVEVSWESRHPIVRPHSLLEAQVVLTCSPCVLAVSGLVRDEHPLCTASDDQSEQQGDNGYVQDA